MRNHYWRRERVTRSLLSLLAGTLLAAGAPAPADAAAPRLGGTCKKQHQVILIKSVRAKCTLVKVSTVRGGGQLVWKAVSPVKPPTSTAQPTPSPAPKPPTAPTSLTEMREKATELAEISWSLAEATRIAPQRASTVRLTVGPQTKLNFATPQTIFDRVATVLGSAKQAPRVDFLVFNYADREWVTSYYTSIKAPNERPVFIANQHLNIQCPRPDRCNGGGLEADSRGHVIVTMASETSGRIDPEQVSGGTIAHEFAHTFQEAAYIGSGRTAQNSMPAWLMEGYASWIQGVASNSSLKGYLNFRNGMVAWGKATISFDEQGLLGIIDAISKVPEFGGYGGETYAAGMLAVEALISWKGIDAPMEITRRLAGGADFQTAFAAVTGEPWESARLVLAKTMALSATS